MEEFAHGFHYGDYSGVVLYGPPTNGLWLDRLVISDCYFVPLFYGLLDRAWRDSGGEQVSRLASEWNTIEGWAAENKPVPVSPADATDFAVALSQLSPADVAEHCMGCTVEECLRCAVIVSEFIRSRLERGLVIFIEDD